MNYWMVRRKDFSFIRPMPEQQIIRMIEGGELRPDDEICKSGGHWIYLNEVNEIRKALGEVKLERVFAFGKEDVTSETSTAKTLAKTVTVAIKAPEVVPEKKVFPKMKMPEPPEAQTVLKGVIFVLAVFSVFILMLISFWLSTY